ncbi:hypothetical protein JVT61DRAFT_13427 [Boletus reticuloceps]|uniref:Uncharacterized protein n=1 Tax=Boletus reticuloceps TaxID=495285 RepID=A0A8I2YDI2_9AGAM|nr:hypothetical protein JVT61DRAFT_13427 [Boletus reticuloceps]
MSMPLVQLGVTQQPPTSKISDLLENTPPRDGQTARHWFEVLLDHISAFSSSDRNKLLGLPFVPMGPPSALKFLPPTKCYLNQGSKPKLYAKLSVFVNFGDRANDFLCACGLKNQVVIEDIAEVLIENPQQFFDFAGGYEDFLVELRKIAYQRRDISNPTLHKMSDKHALLGVRRQKAEDQDEWHYNHKFLTSQEVTIVNDSDDYQLFSDRLFITPQEEEVLEHTYININLW